MFSFSRNNLCRPNPTKVPSDFDPEMHLPYNNVLAWLISCTSCFNPLQPLRTANPCPALIGVGDDTDGLGISAVKEAMNTRTKARMTVVVRLLTERKGDNTMCGSQSRCGSVAKKNLSFRRGRIYDRKYIRTIIKIKCVP